MQRPIIATLFFLFLCSINISAQIFTPEYYETHSFEDIRIVLKNMQVRRTAVSPAGHSVYEVVRKGDGYYLMQKSWDEVKMDFVVKGYQRFWSLSNFSYEAVSLPEGVEISYDAINFLGAKEELFFGYPEASDDIIKLYEPYKSKKCEHWNMLGRAYTNKAMSVLDDRSPLEKFQTKYNPDNIDAERMQRFTNYANLSIACFTKAVELCPDHPTIVGTYKVKLDQTYMTYYYSLSMHGQTTEANKYLNKKPLFDEFRLEMIRNMMRSCRPNSVLVVSGDADTYMALYLQEKMNFRKDLILIHTFLPNLPSYISYILKKYPQLKTSIQAQYYKEDITSVIYPNISDPMSKIEFGKLATAINAKSPEIYNNGYLTLKHARISIGYENIRLKGVIYRGDLFLLDLLYTNPSVNVNISAVGDYTVCGNTILIENQGLTKRVMISGISEEGTEQETLSNKIFSDSVKFPVLEKTSALSSDQISIINGTKDLVRLHAEDLISNGQMDKAFEWLNKVREIYPDDLYEFDATLPYIAQLYYDNGKQEEAFKIMDVYYQKCKKGMEMFDQENFSQENYERHEKLHSGVILAGMFTNRNLLSQRYPGLETWGLSLDMYKSNSEFE